MNADISYEKDLHSSKTVDLSISVFDALRFPHDSLAIVILNQKRLSVQIVPCARVA